MNADKEILGYFSVKRDVTEIRRLESELRQAQKMEAIGTLAGGIAHDFNNILSALMGYAELAQMRAENNPKLTRNLDEVIEAAERARDLVKQILTFSRKDSQEKKPLQVSAIAKEALKLLRSSIPSTIEIKQDFSSQGLVLADPTQIHQIFMNLCTNGYHAMRETGGILTVSLQEIDITGDDFIPGIDLSPGKYLQIEVTDTGQGMDAETQKRIFDPYFTTKKTQEGTGLGLAVVHGIILSHHGQIAVYSEEGKGTSFHVYLPLVEESRQTKGEIDEQAVIQGKNEHILFVDDEEKLVHVAEESFPVSGYQITAHTNPLIALENFKKQPDKYDIIITDMTMPGMTGIELADKIKKMRPDMPIILCTGYSELVSREEVLSTGIKKYLQKPVTMKTLVKIVGEILGC